MTRRRRRHSPRADCAIAAGYRRCAHQRQDAGRGVPSLGGRRGRVPLLAQPVQRNEGRGGKRLKQLEGENQRLKEHPAEAELHKPRFLCGAVGKLVSPAHHS